MTSNREVAGSCYSRQIELLQSEIFPGTSSLLPELQAQLGVIARRVLAPGCLRWRVELRKSALALVQMAAMSLESLQLLSPMAQDLL